MKQLNNMYNLIERLRPEVRNYVKDQSNRFPTTWEPTLSALKILDNWAELQVADAMLITGYKIENISDCFYPNPDLDTDPNEAAGIEMLECARQDY